MEGNIMKKELILAVAAYFLLSISVITVGYAVEESAKTITISEKYADITGDNLNDGIILKGVPYQNENSYLKKIFIDVSASNQKVYIIPLESGAKASFRPIDLNNDGVKDIFATVLTGGSGGITINYLYSVKDFMLTNISVPDPLELESRFINGYKAFVKIKETGKTYLFTLQDRKKYYEKLGLYHKGKLNEPTELTVNPYNRLEPTRIKNGKMGLRGIQRITGIANADTIAYVESFWSYGDGKWNFINAEVLKKQPI
jgi:hypothetical protein